jgi:hypothetical protein
MNNVALLIDGRSTAALGGGTFQRIDPMKGSGGRVTTWSS